MACQDDTFRSGLYECRVMHARLAPRRHRFDYRLFLFALDLDELPALARRFRLFSCERRSLFSFRNQDYLPIGPASDLKSRVQAFAAAQGIDLAGGRVMLVTLPRVAGYLFNPVSFYFCYDRGGQPAAAIAEVTNTFREVKPYLISAGATAAQEGFRRRVPKYFYVSPFSDVDVAFDFNLRLPDQQLRIQIDDYAGTTRTLTSTVRGVRREITDARLGWYAIKYPLVTLQVIALIHWQALRLWLKRVPWYPKAARAADQRDLFRAHRSSLPAASAPAGRPPLPLPTSDPA